MGQSLCHRLQSSVPFAGLHAFGVLAAPAQAHRAAVHARCQAPVAGGFFQLGRQTLPIDQATRQLQTRGQHIAHQLVQLHGGQLLAQKIDPDLVELVGLVEDRHTHRGQQLGHTRLTHRQVGKKQMVVDDHHIRGHGLFARQVDVASTVARAARAQAVVAGGGDQRPQGRALVQTRQLGHVATAGGLRPSLDFGQSLLRTRLRRLGAVAGLLHAVQAQVVGSPLEQGHANGQTQHLDQARDVARKQLVLQRLGGRGHQRPLAAEQDRHQVRIGFAGARARLHHQLAAVLHRAAHGHGHVGLALAGLKARHRVRQHPGAGQGFGDPLIEQIQAGSLGANCACRLAIWSRSASRRFFMRRRRSSSK